MGAMERKKICLFAYWFITTSQLSNAWTMYQSIYSTRIRKHIIPSIVLPAAKEENNISDEAKEIDESNETKLENITTEYKRPVFSDSEADSFEPTNPFTNRGDFVNGPNINEALR